MEIHLATPYRELPLVGNFQPDGPLKPLPFIVSHPLACATLVWHCKNLPYKDWILER